MREHLLPFLGQRLAVTGTVERFGCKPKFADLYQHTICLADVRTADGAPLTDHTWFTVGVRFAALDPQIGDVLTLRATVKPYTKHKAIVRRRDGRYRYIRRTEDLTLRYPAKIEKIATAERSACDGC